MSDQPTIKDAREALGMSLETVAAKAGISTSTVWRCEKNGKWPRQYRTRSALALVLGVDINDTISPAASARLAADDQSGALP